jgi:PhnB protein
MQANIYLNFNGNCEEAFNFYKSVFGGDFTYVGRFKDMPADSGHSGGATASEGEKIMHISLPVGQSTIMGSDTGGEWAPGFTLGNNFSISLNPDSKEDTDRIFNAISAGGKATMPLSDTFWGDYFGMCEDKFGINWMFSYNDGKNKPSQA